jgi:5-methylcytosine-specific restriction protein B
MGSLQNNLSAQQDERTISVYLAFKFPEKYILYKSDYYQNYCVEAGASSQKTGKRFTHLNLLADTWIKHDQLNDQTFKETYRSFYPKPSWNDDRLMIQNILYVCYREEKNGASLVNILDKFDYDDLLNYFAFLDEIISHFNLKENDKKLVFNYNERQLKFTVGQRYVWNIRAIKSKDYTFRVIATNRFSLSHEKFDGLPTAFLNNETNFNLITSNKTSIFEAIQNELSRAKVSGYAKHNDSTIEKLVFDLDYREHIFSQLYRNKKNDNDSQINNNPAMNSFPLNQILYGAPGTGKTYTTKKIAIEIIDGKEYLDSTEEDRDIILARYNELAFANQIHFTTFHQSMSYEDFIEGIKPENVDDQIKYEVKDGIFKQIAEYASVKNETNFEESYNNLVKEILEKENDYLVLTTPKNKTFRVNVNSNNNLNLFTSENINKQGTLTKEKLFKQVNGHQEFNGWEGYVTSVINYLKDKHNLKISGNTIEKKYVLIIDEINRGNVSSIFGELITLLEEDKRKGNKEEIEVVLPYSQEKFSVPNNLYIIGTMNTADRSVESLDTALRRRFSFVEMPSLPEKLVDITLEDAEEIDLEQLLDKINQRIELLIDKDHQIGHSFFINLKDLNGLRTVFKNKIIPLLEEYFFGDFGKIGLVLGENFISVKNENNNSGILAKFSAYEEVDFITEKKVYQIKNCNELKAQDFISIYE